MPDLTPPDTSTAMPADWARPLASPEAFAREQALLAHVWTFLGLADDLARDGDWIRATIATRSVFVQRFGSELKGFENVCAHRFFPLRTADRGNGPIVCGFHHWRYNKDGQALGIPVCEDVFGMVSRALDARLNPVEIATCGALVFGRFPAAHATQSLEDFLGDAFPILAALAHWSSTPRLWSLPINANWRLSLHISLDDYHIAAIHPRTLAPRIDNYLERATLTYARVGLHNAYLTDGADGAFEKYVAGCRDGSLQGSHYTILQVMPNLNMVHVRTDGGFYSCVLHQYVPLAHDRTLLRAWIYPAPFDGQQGWLARRTRWLTEPFRTPVAAHMVKRILREDAAACEQLQQTVGQIDRPPRLGALEERIGWFEESYRRLLDEARSPTE